MFIHLYLLARPTSVSQPFSSISWTGTHCRKGSPEAALQCTAKDSQCETSKSTPMHRVGIPSKVLLECSAKEQVSSPLPLIQREGGRHRYETAGSGCAWLVACRLLLVSGALSPLVCSSNGALSGILCESRVGGRELAVGVTMRRVGTTEMLARSRTRASG